MPLLGCGARRRSPAATSQAGSQPASQPSSQPSHLPTSYQYIYPATAPPLGFAFRREDGDGFADRSPAGEEVRPKRYAALDAARRASAPAPPAVLDGTLLRELLELPEKTQREVLTFGAEGAGTAEATLETARRVLETVLFSFS